MRRSGNVRLPLLAGGLLIALAAAPLSAQRPPQPDPFREPPGQPQDPFAADQGQPPAPILAPAPDQIPPPKFVPDEYIVVFKDAVANPHAAAQDMAQRHGVAVEHVYSAALKGFSAAVPPGRLEGLRRDPRVSYLEPDQVAEAQGRLEPLGEITSNGEVTNGQTLPFGAKRIGADQSVTANINNVDDRVSVKVAVIDSGIQTNHPDLYVAGGYNVTSTKRDGYGHGTHVAGTIGALDNTVGVVGVAPGVPLFAVKVMDNNGYGKTSWVIAGVDWVTNYNKSNPAAPIRVANMSLGVSSSSTLLTSLNNAVATGVAFCVSAGNSRTDCRGTSPANSTSPGVVTVSALADYDGLPGSQYAGATVDGSADDWIWSYSNNGVNQPKDGDPEGNGVDVIAPGVKIYSTYKGSGYATMTGTSMAAPHTAGVAALCIAANPGLFDPANPGGWATTVKKALLTSPPGTLAAPTAETEKVYYWTAPNSFWDEANKPIGANGPYYYGGPGVTDLGYLHCWRAISGDYDAGYPTWTYNEIPMGYEPLVRGFRGKARNAEGTVYPIAEDAETPAITW